MTYGEGVKYGLSTAHYMRVIMAKQYQHIAFIDKTYAWEGGRQNLILWYKNQAMRTAVGLQDQ